MPAGYDHDPVSTLAMGGLPYTEGPGTLLAGKGKEAETAGGVAESQALLGRKTEHISWSLGTKRECSAVPFAALIRWSAGRLHELTEDGTAVGASQVGMRACVPWRGRRTDHGK
jgi:hypothetical protein